MYPLSNTVNKINTFYLHCKKTTFLCVCRNRHIYKMSIEQTICVNVLDGHNENNFTKK